MKESEGERDDRRRSYLNIDGSCVHDFIFFDHVTIFFFFSLCNSVCSVFVFTNK